MGDMEDIKNTMQTKLMEKMGEGSEGLETFSKMMKGGDEGNSAMEDMKKSFFKKMENKGDGEGLGDAMQEFMQ